MDKKKKIFLITGISLLVLIAIVGGTYAWLSWSGVVNISGTSECFEVNYVKGQDIGSDSNPANFSLASTYTEGLSSVIKVNLKDTCTISNGTGTLYLNTDSTTSNILLTSNVLKYQVLDGTNEVASGIVSSTGNLPIYNNIEINNQVKELTVYIWIDGANYTNPKSMMNQTFSFKLHADGEGAVLKRLTAAETITNVYMDAAKETVTNNSIIYNTAPSVSLMNDGLSGGNIRYYGASPNNYIYFNCSDYSNQSSSTCETWRIIGVFNGKVKLIRGSQIGKYSWDSSVRNVNYGWGFNDWSQADLMKLLNSGYDSESVGGSLYWNAQSGTCFSGRDNATVDCDFTSTGIKNDETRNMIAEVTYNLGGWNDTKIYPNQIYVYERGRTVFSGRPTTWTGKIAVAYPSDYGYAADLNQCKQTLVNYDNSTCTSNNWMKNIVTNNGGNYGWLLTHRPDSSSSTWTVRREGLANNISEASGGLGVVPVLSLSSELGIESGDGSSSNPYKLSA
mgnify:CR=1 FL=1